MLLNHRARKGQQSSQSQGTWACDAMGVPQGPEGGLEEGQWVRFRFAPNSARVSLQIRACLHWGSMKTSLEAGVLAP